MDFSLNCLNYAACCGFFMVSFIILSWNLVEFLSWLLLSGKLIRRSWIVWNLSWNLAGFLSRLLFCECCVTCCYDFRLTEHSQHSQNSIARAFYKSSLLLYTILESQHKFITIIYDHRVNLKWKIYTEVKLVME